MSFIYFAAGFLTEICHGISDLGDVIKAWLPHDNSGRSLSREEVVASPR